jgi:hypothetical protein
MGLTLLPRRKGDCARELLAGQRPARGRADSVVCLQRRGFGDWLYFVRGPYSAKAIEIRTSVPRISAASGLAQSVGCADLLCEGRGAGRRRAGLGQRAAVLSLLGTAWAWLTARRRHSPGRCCCGFRSVLCVFGGLRLGAHLSARLVAALLVQHALRNGAAAGLALGLGFAAQFVLAAVNEFKPREQPSLAPRRARTLFACVALNAGKMLRERPLVYVEGTKNIDARRPTMSRFLRRCARCSPSAGRRGADGHVGLSGDRRLHRDSAAPDHQRERSGDLSRRAGRARRARGIVLAFDGDEIDRAVKAHPEGLTAVRRFSTPGKPAGTIYVSGTPVAH